MANRRKTPFPKESVPLKHRVQDWRDGRNGPEPMPDELWREAVRLAREYGTCLIARAVGIDYAALRTRVRKATELPGLVKPTFIELPTGLPLGKAMEVPTSTGGSWTAGTGSLIELSRPDGSQMRIHLEAGRGDEVAGLVAAFLGDRG